jgi:antitoxin ParD1/3/4
MGVAMPTRNVSLTEELDRFIVSRVETGRYENASEVVRAGLRALEMDEQEHEEKMAWLRQALDEGLASGVARGDVFARVRRKVGLRPEKR